MRRLNRLNIFTPLASLRRSQHPHLFLKSVYSFLVFKKLLCFWYVVTYRYKCRLLKEIFDSFDWLDLCDLRFKRLKVWVFSFCFFWFDFTEWRSPRGHWRFSSLSCCSAWLDCDFSASLAVPGPLSRLPDKVSSKNALCRSLGLGRWQRESIKKELNLFKMINSKFGVKLLFKRKLILLLFCKIQVHALKFKFLNFLKSLNFLKFLNFWNLRLFLKFLIIFNKMLKINLTFSVKF